MDAALVDQLNQISSQPGVVGVICSDKKGLCIGARGTASVGISGYYTSIEKRAQKLENEDHPTITIETDSTTTFIKSNGDVTLAVIKS